MPIMRAMRKGFTLLEVLVALVIVGAMATVAIPRIKNGMSQESVRNARRTVVTHLSRARGAAASRGCTAVFHLAAGSSARVWVTSCALNGAGIDTVGSVDNITDRYGVLIAANSDSVIYAPTGLGISGRWMSVRFKKATSYDTLGISAIGKAFW